MISNFHSGTGNKPKKILIGYDEFINLLGEVIEHDYAYPSDHSDNNFIIIDGVIIGWSK
jgi:hypothetical protein